MKRAFVAWMRYHRRSDLLAQHLGATTYFIQYEPPGKFLRVPVKYVVQGWRTWRALSHDRPDVVFVQNPPIFCVLVAFLYSRIYGARYVIDSHTGAFLSPKWRWSLGLHRLLSKGALVTIVHNTSQEQIVKAWGCRYLVIGFTPGSYPPGEEYALEDRFNVAVVSSFLADEPVDLVFEAAARLSEVDFHVTGDSGRIRQDLLSSKPENCHLTGYLTYDRYVGLLREVDAIMVLTTGNHTLLMGAFEAVSVGTPLIVSNWPVLRDYFSLGTVYVDNTVAGICKGVSQARAEQTRLKQEMLLLQERLESEWAQKSAELERLLQE